MLTFLRTIEKDFLNDGKVSKWRKLKLELLKTAIWKTNKSNNTDFCRFIDQHYLHNDKEFKVFCEAYNLVLKDLVICPESSYINAKKLMLSPVIRRDNFVNDRPIRNAIINRCIANLDYGIEFFYLVKKDSEFNGTLLADIISA